MSWSRNEVTILLEEYKKYPNLYNPKSSNYKNRNLRLTSLENILHCLKTIKPDITLSDCQTKFQGLKTNFLKEYKKHVNSKRSGIGDEDVYIPTLWYYDLMLFVLDGNIPRESFDTIRDETFENSQVANEVIIETMDEVNDFEHSQEDEILDDVTTPIGKASTSNCTLEQPPKRLFTDKGVKRKRNSSQLPSTDTVLEQASRALKHLVNSISEKKLEPAARETNSNKAFGEFVVSKLNCINNEDIQLEAEFEIAQVLYSAIQKSRNPD